jgi:hypothetical protein
MTGRFASADDSDRVATIRMRDKKESTARRRTKGETSVFEIRMIDVIESKRLRIRKDRKRFFK